jgi:hypothetical protein
MQAMREATTVAVDIGGVVAVVYLTLTLAIVGVGVGAMFRRRRGTQAGALSAAASALGATVGRVTIPGVLDNTLGFKCVVGGHPLYVFAFNRRGVHFVEILLDAPGARGFIVLKRRRPRWLAGIGNAIGLGPNLGLGDFERAVGIESDESDEVKRTALSAPETRRGILSALDTFETVSISPRGVSVGSPAADIEAGRVPFSTIADTLRAICDAQPTIAGAIGKPPRRRSDAIPFVAAPFVGCMLLFVMFAVFGKRWPIGAEGWTQGLGLAACIWLVMMVGVYVYIRRTTRSFALLILAIWTTALAVPLCIASLLWTINAVADHSPLSRVRATVVGKVHSSSLRGGSRWMLQLRPDGKDETWRDYVSRKRFESAQPGDVEIAAVHRGLFGWAWGTWVPEK